MVIGREEGEGIDVAEGIIIAGLQRNGSRIIGILIRGRV